MLMIAVVTLPPLWQLSGACSSSRMLRLERLAGRETEEEQEEEEVEEDKDDIMVNI